MGKKKRVNPNKKRLSGPVDVETIVYEASIGNMYHAWLLLLPSLISSYHLSPQDVISLQDAVNAHAQHPDFVGKRMKRELRKAQELICFQQQYILPDPAAIHTEAALASFKRKLRANALYSALSLICLGLMDSGRFSDEDISQIFLNAKLSLAEVESGLTNYEKLAAEVREYGVKLEEDGDDMVVEIVDE